MKEGRFATVAAGLALAVSLMSMFWTRQAVQQLTDHALKQDAEMATLRVKVENDKKDVFDALAEQMLSLCKELGGGDKCGASEGGAATPYPDSLVSKMGVPSKSGSEIHVKVDRKAADEVFAGMEHMPREIAMLPSVKDGKPFGFEIQELREGGLGPALGFENGDVIRTVNGKPFSSTAEIAALSVDLPKASQIKFELVRKGAPLSIVVDIK